MAGGPDAGRRYSARVPKRPTSGSRPVLFVLALGAALAAFAAVTWVRAVEPMGMDQGLFACFGRWVGEGLLPYRDIWDSKPPAMLFTFPVAFALFGTSVGALWTFEALWLLASGAVAFFVAARLWGRWAGLAAAAFLLAGMWSPAWGTYWNRAQAEEFLGLFMTAAAGLALAPRGGWSAFGCGVLTGLAGLYKVPALLLLAAWPWSWLADGVRPTLRRSLALFAGAALPGLAALGHFAVRGALDDMLRAVWEYNRLYVRDLSQDVSWSTTLSDLVRTPGAGVPVLCGMAALGVALLLARRSREGVWLATWTVTCFAAVALQRQLAGYHFLLLVPPLALAASCGLVETARATLRAGPLRLLAGALLVACAALAAWQASRWWTAYGIDLAYRRGAIDRGAYLRGLANGAELPAEEDALVRFTQANSRETERVLVWGISPGTYFLAGRRPATVYPFHNLLLTDSPLSRRFAGLAERRARFLEELRAAPPAVILVGTRDENGFEPEDSYRQMLRFAEFRSFVERNYDPAGEIGRYRAYKRRAPAVAQ